MTVLVHGICGAAAPGLLPTPYSTFSLRLPDGTASLADLRAHVAARVGFAEESWEASVMGIFRIDEDIPVDDQRLLHAEYDPREVFRVAALPSTLEPVSMWIPKLHDEGTLHILVSLPPAQAVATASWAPAPPALVGESPYPVAPPRRAVLPDVALATGFAAASAAQSTSPVTPSSHAGPASSSDYSARPPDYTSAVDSSHKAASMSHTPASSVLHVQSPGKSRIATPLPPQPIVARISAFMRTRKGLALAGVIGAAILVAIISGVVIGHKSSNSNSDAQAAGGRPPIVSPAVATIAPAIPTIPTGPVAATTVAISTAIRAASTTSRPIASPTPLPGNWLVLRQSQFMGTPIPGPAGTVSLGGADLAGCGTLCRAAAGCIAGQMIGTICYLMQSFDGRAVTNAAAAITYPNISGMSDWNAVAGQDQNGHDFDPTGTCPPAASGAQCAPLCAIIPACRGVNFNSAADNRFCCFKTSVSTLTPNRDVTLIIKP
ncbi:hypothetical protein HDU86_004419 [Geranomyces michiganensis]|nr:hypothetical protein HDU86_004419 [Geranomyces michiganensis]